MAALDQRADQRLHLVDIVGGARLDSGIEAAERPGVSDELGFGLLGDLADGLVERQVGKIAQGAGVDLVVHVGDVAHIGYMIGAIDVAQQPEQHVKDDDRARIADMGEIIHRGAADIEPHIVRIDGKEVFLLTGQRIVELELRRGHMVRPWPCESALADGSSGIRKSG